MNPAGYHLVNILLHAANAALFDAVARRLLAAALPDTALTPRRLGPRPPRSCSRSIRCAWSRSPGSRSAATSSPHCSICLRCSRGCARRRRRAMSGVAGTWPRSRCSRSGYCRNRCSSPCRSSCSCSTSIRCGGSTCATGAGRRRAACCSRRPRTWRWPSSRWRSGA